MVYSNPTLVICYVRDIRLTNRCILISETTEGEMNLLRQVLNRAGIQDGRGIKAQ